jgi:coniferyl-aldehyde dehydrogenase
MNAFPATPAALSSPASEDAKIHLKETHELQRRSFLHDGPPSYEKRLRSLDRLLRLSEQYEARIADAISEDFGNRSRFETSVAEVLLVLAGIKHARRKLKSWMKPRRAPVAIQFWPGRNEIMPQPLGVVGIISPWNYPFYLSFSPVIAALAAGNRVILKPSEITPRTSSLLQQMVASEFPPEEFTVVTGGPEVGEAVASTPFDHLFFTGSTASGRKVALAAAQNLTPVTLELGGKSPAIISDDYSIARAAERIVFGKMLNAGQTCIAPDYVLVPEAKLPEFIAQAKSAAAKLYPKIAGNPDSTSIVNERHFQRLTDYVDESKRGGADVISIVPLAEALGAGDRRMPLRLIIGPREESRVMQEEIFGPILPVVPYRSLDEVIAYVNNRPRPLAMYWFGDSAVERDRMLQRTFAGGVTINDTLWHICQEELPFGGVGASGSGAYHGIHGFRTFSKEKGIFYQSRWNAGGRLNPPFGKTAQRTLKLLRKLI